MIDLNMLENSINFIGDYRMYLDEEFRYVFYENIKPYMYIISSYGRVFNIISGRELSQVDNNGYRDVVLQTIDNKRKTVRAHRLVATAFIPYTEEDFIMGRNFVNHKDLCRANNHVSNLEWCNHDENMEHASYMYNTLGLQQAIIFEKAIGNWSRGDLTKGENNGMSRLTEAQVHLICQALEMGYSDRDCLVYAGLEDTENNRFIVSHIAIGKRWKHISKLYNIPERRKLINLTEYIIPVCELLQQGKKAREIYNELQLFDYDYERSRHFIQRIHRRQTYTEISSNYVW